MGKIFSECLTHWSPAGAVEVNSIRVDQYHVCWCPGAIGNDIDTSCLLPKFQQTKWQKYWEMIWKVIVDFIFLNMIQYAELNLAFDD